MESTVKKVTHVPHPPPSELGTTDTPLSPLLTHTLPPQLVSAFVLGSFNSQLVHQRTITHIIML